MSSYAPWIFKPKSKCIQLFEKIIYLAATAWKVSKYGAFSGPYFPAFGLNTDRYGVSLRIQSECGKTRTRKNTVFGHFLRSVPTGLLQKRWPKTSKNFQENLRSRVFVSTAAVIKKKPADSFLNFLKKPLGDCFFERFLKYVF